jgi:Peptidase inhibitor I78 family
MPNDWLRPLVPALFLAVALSACGPAMTKPGDGAPDGGGTAPPVSRGPCQADGAQSFVGQKASGDVQEQARNAAGASIVRTLQPGQPITKEFNGERLNLHVDADNNVIRVNCG